MTTTNQKTTTRKKAAPKPVQELANNPFAFEVLQLVSKQRSKSKKIEILQKYGENSLKAVFIWNFDESVVSLLPEGPVPYATNGEQHAFSGNMSGKIADAVQKMEELGTNSLGMNDQGQTTIRAEFRKFYNFLRNGNPGLTSTRRETLFIDILRGLHPLEAEILVLIKDKKLQTKYNITKDIVSTAYPDIKWGNRS
jgi:hypothetical protein